MDISHLKKDNYTYIDQKGSSVIDYAIVPHTERENVIDFGVIPTSVAVNHAQVTPGISSTLPDHSLIWIHYATSPFTSTRHSEHNTNQHNIRGHHNMHNFNHESTRHYHVQNIPPDMFTNPRVHQALQDVIDTLPLRRIAQESIDQNYVLLINDIIKEM